MKMQRENKFRFEYMAEIGRQKKLDLFLFHMGSQMLVHVISPKALKELEAKVPSIIDRNESKGFITGRNMKGSYIVTPSNKDWELRRKEIKINKHILR